MAMTKEKYILNPKLCIHCNSAIDYEKRVNKFCNHSCSATFNNLKKNVVKCITCLKVIKNPKGKIYCSHECHNVNEKNKKLDILLSGENVSFDIRSLKNMIIYHFGYQCMSCKNSEWMNNPIPLELHHIDGAHENNRIWNLSILCPNCHALTDNYKAKNKVGTRKYRNKMQE